jgi:hypothetical protein
MMERCLAEQLKHHLKDVNFLRPNQFGFRSNHSCESCLIKIADDCRLAMDKGNCVGLVSLDISKAFDSLHPDGIIASLKSAGVDDNALEWFVDYLKHRQQMVKMEETFSSLAQVDFGVPQGSVLGPLLYTIYVNELPLQAPDCSVQQFADDTTVYASGKTPADVAGKLNTALAKIKSWMHQNCLQVNAKKTNYMFLSLCRAHEPPRIFLDGIQLQPTPSIKLLGFKLDNRLSMAEQIDSVVKKVRSGAYALRISRRFLDERSRLLLYNGLVASHLNYCDMLLAQAGKTNLKKLQTVQDQAVRAVCKAPLRASADPLLQHLGFLNLEGKRCVHMATAVWKCVHGIAPEALSAFFQPVEEVHQHRTRGSTTDALFVRPVRTEQARRSFGHQAAMLWRKLPANIRTARSAHECRERTYRYFLSAAAKKP